MKLIETDEELLSRIDDNLQFEDDILEAEKSIEKKADSITELLNISQLQDARENLGKQKAKIYNRCL